MNITSSKKIFFDESTETDSTESEDVIPTTNFIIPPRPFLSYVLIYTKSYDFKSWDKYFSSGKIDLTSNLMFNPSWFELFRSGEMRNILNKIEIDLTKEMEKNKSETIVPFPELLFNIMNLVDIDKIKVVILGQDPYPGNLAAIGCSFSAPIGLAIPSSLSNIFKNLIKFKHINSMPETACLSGWILQGCFMLNASLTTFLGKSNVHKKIWLGFSRKLLSYINDKCSKCIFVAWGADAFNMLESIDREKHIVLSSSHPSGFSCSKTFKTVRDGKVTVHSSFDSIDHFGKINSHLKLNGREEIIWDLLI